MRPFAILKNTVIPAILLSCFSPAVSGEVSFVHIGLEQGLSQSTVLDIEQDFKGNMWFATYDGLNRYDGYTFTVYRHDDTDPTSISNDIIRCVMADDKGRLWVGTYSGLSFYDSEQDSFKNFGVSQDGAPVEVQDIIQIDADRLLLDTSAGLRVFSIGTSAMADFHASAQDSRNSMLMTGKDEVTAMEKYGDKVIIGTKNGKLLISKSASNTPFEDIGMHVLEGKRIQSIFLETFPVIYIGTEGHGLYRINLTDGSHKHFCTASGSLSSDYVRAIRQDGTGNIWIGTFSSLNIIDAKSGKISVYDSDPVKEGGLSQSSVRAIFKDTQGGMWIGTYFGGLNYYHPLLRRFSTIRHIPYHNSLNDNVVSCITEDAGGDIWIGTNSGGVNRFDPRTGRFAFYTTDNGLAANDIKALYIHGGKVYTGLHHGGLGIIDTVSGNIRNIHVGDGNVYAIIPYKDGNIVLGTVDGFLWEFSLSSGSFRKMEEAGSGMPVNTGKLVSLKYDSKGRIWAGTESGLKIYTDTGNGLSLSGIVPQNGGLAHTFVNCIAECGDGTFWLGTRNGLYCFDESDGSLAHYTVADGLPSNVVYGILEDEAGNLWISGGHGLSRFDKKNRSFRNYTSADGLQSDQFCLYSYWKSSSGKMYFGGINGITVFDPEALPDNYFIPTVSITGLSVSNKPVRPGDGSGILDSDIAMTDEIHLNQRNSSFALTFAVTDYVSWKQNLFAYRLEGYDDGWKTVMDPNRTVSYSNLPPGKYLFSVTAANKDGIWNKKPAILSIIIHPHWYNTVLARIAFALAIIGTAVFVTRYLWVRKRMKMQLAFEKVDKERIREVNEMKLRFFINISHELRTPLTMIVSPLQDLLAVTKDKQALRKLKYIEKSTGKLLYLVNQLMDYRRAELGVFRLKVKEMEIQPVLDEIFGYYKQHAASEKIDYRLESSLDGRRMYFDRQYVEIILNNLLSNAFKYTPEGHSITLAAKMDGDMCLLQVKDTGQGIAPEKQKLVFERFYQVDQNHIGSGIGLGLVKNLAELHHGRVGIESSIYKGSTFSVWIPANASAYSENEISDGENDGGVYFSNPAEMHILNAASGADANEADIDNNAREQDGNESAVEGMAKIMIVEDNKEILEYLSDGLSAGYSVIVAGNGREALDKMNDEMPDIIITDVMMPVMDGFKLCRHVKQNLYTSHIPVIILSAKSDAMWQMSGLKVGADDYIPKPFSMSIVEAKIKNILRTRMSIIDYFSKSHSVKPERLALNKLDEDFLKKAVGEVERHIDDTDFSADMFAELMNMSRSNLHIKMKALTGSSALDFIRKIRFSKACSLLKEGRYSVADISAMVGFGSPAYFATSFKKYIGCLPSEYAKRDQQKE